MRSCYQADLGQLVRFAKASTATRDLDLLSRVSAQETADILAER